MREIQNIMTVSEVLSLLVGVVIGNVIGTFVLRVFRKWLEER